MPSVITMGASARQSPSKRNTTVAPKMAAAEVLTGIYGHILLCADAYRRQQEIIRYNLL